MFTSLVLWCSYQHFSLLKYVQFFFAVIRWDLQATVWLMIFNTLIFFQIVPDTKNSEKFFSKQW